MQRAPKDKRRQADVVSHTGEIDQSTTADGRNAAAVALGRRGGLARAKKLNKKRRVEIAKAGAAASARARRKDR